MTFLFWLLIFAETHTLIYTPVVIAGYNEIVQKVGNSVILALVLKDGVWTDFDTSNTHGPWLVF